MKINKFEKIMSKKSWICLTIFFSIVGVSVFIISINDYIKLNIVKSHEMIIGETIIADLRYNVHKSDSSWSPTFEYKYIVNGIEYKNYDIIHSSKISWNLPKEGDKIKILYNKNDPKISDVFFIDYNGIIVSLLIISVSIFLWIKIKVSYSK